MVEGADPDLSRKVGAALRDLHSMAPPPEVAAHDAAAEVGVLRRWTVWASRYGLVGPDRLAEESRIAADLLAGESPSCLVHRDFHDRQVLIGPDGAVGIIDFDTLAIGEPAIDLANALAHLDWVAAQGLAPAQRIAEHAEAFLSGYSPSPATLARLLPYRRATRLRLECLHAFRPKG
jgi:aminoglycoside phosphotransferase (APT) family kinase protein